MNIFWAGWIFLIHYLTPPRVVAITIAFFISGAIAQFVSQKSILKYFGPTANKAMAYLFASLMGGILVVCSCSVLPLFAIIRQKGAGIGPAVTFLFAGPAINVVAILLTFTLIGIDIGFVRTIAAGVLSMMIGFIMFVLYYPSEKVHPNEAIFNVDEPENRTPWQNVLFFTTLIVLYIFGIRDPITTFVLIALLLVQLRLYFSKKDIRQWCRATYKLAKKIVPLTLVGIFLAGMMEDVVSPTYIVQFVGQNSFLSNVIASTFGTFMYFAALTEVPIVNSFLSLGMHKGPAVALLLAGPSLSLPAIIVIARVLGIKKTITYLLLVVVFSAFIGFLSGVLFFH
ncbi:MAG: permease [Caldisericia bacterium]|nr:permease [Caldisericia bacterium]